MEDISTQLGGFLAGENKPTVQFEMTYTNIAVLSLSIILVIVVSHLIVKAIG